MGVAAFLPMFRPSTPPAARKLFARCTLATKACSPSLLKPSRLISAFACGRRKMRGLGLPGCGFGRDRAHLDEAEAHRAQAVDAAAVLVQARGQADAVGELQPGQFHRIVDPRALPQALRRRVLQPRQGAERQVVGRFRIQAEQEGAGQGVGDQRHGRDSPTDNARVRCGPAHSRQRCEGGGSRRAIAIIAA